ncbi:MAG: hypothetical protein ABIF17_02135 [Patescibacteria group bacterium]
MQEETLSQKVLETIQNKNIKPEPKWKYALRSWLIWVLSAISLILSSLAFAIIIYLLKNNDWELRNKVSRSIFEFIFLSLPYFWVIFVVLVIILVYYNFLHTKKGYKYKWHIIIFVSLFASIVLGILFYSFGIGQVVENELNSHLFIYQKMMRHRLDMWQRPERGVLPGRILRIKSDNEFYLIDLKGHGWNVHCEDNLSIKEGQEVKMIGESIGQDNFKAMQIRPMRPWILKGMPILPRSR